MTSKCDGQVARTNSTLLYNTHLEWVIDRELQKRDRAQRHKVDLVIFTESSQQGYCPQGDTRPYLGFIQFLRDTRVNDGMELTTGVIESLDWVLLDLLWFRWTG